MSKFYFAILVIAYWIGHPVNQQHYTGLHENKTVAELKIIHHDLSKKDSSLKLDFFKSIPETIDGCGEYFTYDSINLSKNKYIFLSNLSDFAFIRVTGKNIQLQRSTTECKEINAKNYISVYSGHGYKAILTVKETKSYEEGGYYAGTLQIISNKIKTLFKVHGQTGC